MIIILAAQYGRVNFWDTYYANEPEPFEWYFDYNAFRETVMDYINKDDKLMIAGVGNSHMPEDVSST